MEQEAVMDHGHDVDLVQAISAVPTILRVVAETTGLRFVCVARVTADSWTTCAVLDQLDFGLAPGDGLDVKTTICDEVLARREAVLIDNVGADPLYRDHHTPKQYGFQSYFSIPVYASGGEFFGTLCGLDPEPRVLTSPKIRDTLTLFAQLISAQLEVEQRLRSSEQALAGERETAELREQFIAVLGHDLRTPLSSIVSGAEVLKLLAPGERETKVIERILRSGKRIANLVDDVMDFTRGKMGGGLPLALVETDQLAQQLRHVVAELESNYTGARIEADIVFDCPVLCDPKRIAQLLSNLLVNAILHGDGVETIGVRARCEDGMLSIAVSNGGAALSDATRARLFQPFWRSERGSSDEGLGLGLYIAGEIARGHSGELAVSCDGARITFAMTARPQATA